MGKRAGQARVLKRTAAKMCSQPRASQPGTVPGYAGTSMHTASTATNSDARRLAIGGNALGAAVAELSALPMGQLRARATSLDVARRDESKMQKRRNQLEEDCRIALEAQQSDMQQEGRRSGSALDVGGSASAGASSLSATPTCGQEAERTTTVPCYASASMNTDVRPLPLRGPPRYGVYPRGWKPGMVFFIPFSDQKLADRFEVGAEGISYFLGANMVFYVGKKAANPGSASVHRSVATIRACAACWSPDPPHVPFLHKIHGAEEGEGGAA